MKPIKQAGVGLSCKNMRNACFVPTESPSEAAAK